MYLLSITINIDDSVRDEWLNWVNTKVKRLITDKNLVYDFRLLKILSEEPGNGSSYSFQYHLHDWESINLYEEQYDLQIATEMYKLYKEKFVEFRTRLEVIDRKL